MKDIGRLYEIFKQSTGVSIDTRTVAEGNLFFAFRGEQSDGNQYAQSAIDKGAICAVIDNAIYAAGEKTFLTDDSLTALQDLARLYRGDLQIPVIALTGSNGKTTTKELMHAVLSKKLNTFATKGNLNNHIGVPLSILSIRKEHEIAVIEMGANHQHEIELLCSIAQPTHGLITNIGLAHLEGFGGPEGVKKGKSELYHYVMANYGVVFANSGEEKLIDVYAGYDAVVKYGFHGDEYLSGKRMQSAKFASVEINNLQMISSLVGNYNADNILAAACVGKYFGIGMHAIREAIEGYAPENNRSELRKIGGNYFILDAYNANPSSMKAAVENFASMDVKGKIAILGDMLELGEYAASAHHEIAALAMQQNFEEIILVGPEFKQVPLNAKHMISFSNSEEAAGYFRNKNYNGKNILLKGSRGIKLEKIIS